MENIVGNQMNYCSNPRSRGYSSVRCLKSNYSIKNIQQTFSASIINRTAIHILFRLKNQSFFYRVVVYVILFLVRLLYVFSCSHYQRTDKYPREQRKYMWQIILYKKWGITKNYVEHLFLRNASQKNCHQDNC